MSNEGMLGLYLVTIDQLLDYTLPEPMLENSMMTLHYLLQAERMILCVSLWE